MRKIVALIAMLLLLTGALAEPAEDKVLIDQEGVTLTVNPGYEITPVNGDELSLSFQGVIDNQTDVPIELWLDNPTINEFQVNADVRLVVDDMQVQPGNKAKCEIWFMLSDADVSSYEEIESLETGFKVFDAANYDWLFETDRYILKGDADVRK